MGNEEGPFPAEKDRALAPLSLPVTHSGTGAFLSQGWETAEQGECGFFIGGGGCLVGNGGHGEGRANDTMVKSEGQGFSTSAQVPL